jgi:acetolactate synthase-1/2/3 large subunit
MKKVSDIISDFIESKKIDTVFLLTGGGIMHLTDSIGMNKNIEYVCNFHEQACAIAAEGYARVTGKPGVCFGTTGPGIANALSGVIGAWHDSIPLMVFGGQVRTSTMADFSKIRQFGPQEGNIMEVAKPMTKYAVSIRVPEMILYELEKAYTISISDRPGPVFLEIPLDIQSAFVDEKNLVKFYPDYNLIDDANIEIDVNNFLELLYNSKKPILFPGNGIRISNSYDLWREFFSLINVPAVLPYCAIDLLSENDELNMGVIGTNGQRRANFAVQNADLFISISSGISISKIGFNPSLFAPSSKKVIIDIDEGQLENQVIKGDFKIKVDVKKFLTLCINKLKSNPYKYNLKWIEACKYWKNRYKLITEDYYLDKEHVNMYVFTNTLSELINNETVVVTGNGFDAVSVYQVFKTKVSQRVLIPGNWGSMGWDLPTAVGACFANSKKQTILITGDGSIMLNIQELLTIRNYNLPVKIFIFNNKGYASIRATQNNLLNGHLVGSDENTGIKNPNFKDLAKAFGFDYYYINNNNEILDVATQALDNEKFSICEINLAYDLKITPKAIAFKKEDGTLESKPLEDMFPFLPKTEIDHNMNLVKNL